MENLNAIKIGERWYDTEVNELATVAASGSDGWVTFYYDNDPSSVKMTFLEFVRACTFVNNLNS